MDTIRLQIFTPGGILGLEDLSKIINTCRMTETEHVQFGQRQEIIAEVPVNNLDRFKRLLKKFVVQSKEETTKRMHNIVSSYVSEEIAQTSFWTKEGIYYEILDQFPTPPSVRVNITDLKQDFVYSFTGDINFVASEEVNYWNVYFRSKENGNLELFNYKIHSEDIFAFTQDYEKLFHSGIANFEMIAHALISKFGTRAIQTDIHPHLKVSEFYNYEGFHEYKSKYWLGIYMRETAFPIEKLDSLRQLARQNRIGYIYITPWKSIIIKGILHETLTDWKFVLAQNGINIGHAHSEMNWQLNDFDAEAIKLKAQLRREFSRRDISLIGVIFGINNNASYSFSHITISKQDKDADIKDSNYTIYYRKDFNPTINEFIPFKTGVPFSQLVDVLGDVIQTYYTIAYHEFSTFNPQPINVESLEKEERELRDIYQCQNCFTIYDAQFGDESQGIQQGTDFEQLPASFKCPVCESTKESYKLVADESIDQLN